MKKAISILLFLMMMIALCGGAMATTYQTGTYSTAENTSEKRKAMPIIFSIVR